MHGLLGSTGRILKNLSYTDKGHDVDDASSSMSHDCRIDPHEMGAGPQPHPPRMQPVPSRTLPHPAGPAEREREILRAQRPLTGDG